MILTLFLALLALSVVVCFLGYFTGDEPYLTVGLFFLFLLSTVIITGNLEYQTGEVHTYAYTPGYCSGNCTIQTAITGDTVTYTFTPWNDSTSQKVGWGLAIASALGTALSFYNTKKRGMNGNG